jgi:hypothetical protein
MEVQLRARVWDMENSQTVVKLEKILESCEK